MSKFSTSHRSEILEKFLSGIDKLALAVGSTLGPNGRNVIIKKFIEKIYTKDGVTVAKNIIFDDPIESLGAEIIRDASIQTNHLAGDGTTTTVVLAHALIHNGLEAMDKGMKASDIAKQLTEDSEKVINHLKENSRLITTPEEVINIASIASNSKLDGELIGGIYNEIGRDGVIVVEDSKTADTWHEVINGLRFDKGFISRYFVTDQKLGVSEIEDPYILITDLDLTFINALVPILDKVGKDNGKNMVVIGSKITGETLMTMLQNHLSGNFVFLPIEAPVIDREEFLEDLALITGGKFISRKMSFQLANLTLEDLGHADKIVSDNDSTIIMGRRGDAKKIEDFVSSLKTDPLANKNRLQRFSSKVAVLKVGARTEGELIAKKFQYEDAIEATKSALEEGIVIGSGMALVNAAKALLPIDSIVGKSCFAPIRKILSNIDKDPDEILFSCLGDNGYNAATEEYVNLWDAGIVDALKVVRCALDNAIAVAILFLKTDYTVLNIKDRPKQVNGTPIDWGEYDDNNER